VHFLDWWEGLLALGCNNFWSSFFLMVCFGLNTLAIEIKNLNTLAIEIKILKWSFIVIGKGIS
jgi:hypothetical protein